MDINQYNNLYLYKESYTFFPIISHIFLIILLYLSTILDIKKGSDRGKIEEIKMYKSIM